jgi:hypothetical protein
MKSLLLLAFILTTGAAQAGDPTYCNGQVIQDSWGSYYPNGKKVKDNWGTYYPNGQTIKDNWGSYYPNKQVLTDNWGTYYPNAKASKDNWGTYYHNGQKTQDNWGCYWANGTKMEPCRDSIKVKARFSADLTMSYTLGLATGRLSDFQFEQYDSAKKVITFFSADITAGEISDMDALCELGVGHYHR